MRIDRRHFLTGAVVAPVVLAGAAGPARADPSACYDPARLALAQRAQRRSLGYADTAPQTRKNCGICAFFIKSGDGCGRCQLMTGAPVVAAGGCASFAPKAT